MEKMEKKSANSIDSYTERRKLFKNIWDTAIEMEENKEQENAPNVKPKVIKTLRLCEQDGINIGKNKKQRIKNLRHVCTRLLDICNRNDTDDILYDQISAARHDSSRTSILYVHPRKHKKKSKKKKVKKAYVAPIPPVAPPTDSPDAEVEDGRVTHRGTKPLRDMFSPRMERATLIQQFLNERYNLEKAPTIPEPTESEEKLNEGDAHRKVVKVVKKHNKRKTASSTSSPPPPRVTSTNKRVPTHKVKKKKQNNDDISI